MKSNKEGRILVALLASSILNGILLSFVLTGWKLWSSTILLVYTIYLVITKEDDTETNKNKHK